MPRVKLLPEQQEALAKQRAIEAASEDEVERDLDHARAHDLQLAARLQQIRADALARRGFDAEQAAVEAEDATASAWNEIAANVTTPRMHDMLRDVFDRRVEVLRHELGAHIGRERLAARRDNAAQLRTLAQQDAIDAETSLGFDTNLKTVLDAIDRSAELDGIDPAESQAEKFRARSTIHAGRILRMLGTGRRDEALAWRAAHAAMLSLTDNDAIGALLAAQEPEHATTPLSSSENEEHEATAPFFQAISNASAPKASPGMGNVGQNLPEPEIVEDANPGTAKVIDKSRMSDPQWWKWYDAHPDSTDIGILARKYETSNRGPGFISSGAGDPGGPSYGAYQLAKNRGRPTDFLAGEGAKWATEFRGLTPYSPQWNAKWRLIGTRDHDDFANAQLQYMARTHFDPVVRATLASQALDIRQLSNGMQNAVFSLATQMGPGRLARPGKSAAGAILVLGRAISRTDARMKRDDPGYERQLIQNLYDARIEFMRNLEAQHVRKSLDKKRTPKERAASAAAARTMHNVVANRYKNEPVDALRLYDQEVAEFPYMIQ